MPLAQVHLAPERQNFQRTLTPVEIESLVDDEGLRVLQTDAPVDPQTWDLLNSDFFSRRPEVELRIYGHYRQICDLAFLSRLGNVRCFAADCLMDAQGVEHIGGLQELRSLSVGIHSLESFEFLGKLEGSELRRLSLGATASRKPSVGLVERFTKLEKLIIEGQQKDIEAIGYLSGLRELILRSITVPSLDFLVPLRELWSLGIKLGGTKNLEALMRLTAVKYLELRQIKGLSDLRAIGDMVGLQFLFLQTLPKVTALPGMSRLGALRRVHLDNMKGLKDFSALEKLPALEELVHVAAPGGVPAQYAALLGMPSLKSLLVGFGSHQKNEELRLMAEAAGKDAYRHTAFRFL